VPWDWAREVRIHHSMPSVVTPEIEKDTEWYIEYRVPLDLFEKYVGPLGPPTGQEWRANFYKCADRSSHPHWAAWAPIGEKLSFHIPWYFGTLRFAK
jgi:hypothetical protein